jgi:hypothetical protein
MVWVVLAAIGVALALIIVGVHPLLTWAERRGWVYYRSTDRPRPHSLGLVGGIYQPSVTHVIEQQVVEETEADQAASGEDSSVARSGPGRSPQSTQGVEDPNLHLVGIHAISELAASWRDQRVDANPTLDREESAGTSREFDVCAHVEDIKGIGQ